MRVPVGVEDDDGVCGLQVEPEAPGARAQHEDEVVAARRVELRQQIPAVVRLGRTVQSQVLVTYQSHAVIVHST